MNTRRGGQVIYGALTDDNDASDGRPLRLDSSTHSIQQLTYEHHEIHAGSLFTFQEGFQLNNASRTYLIRPPSGNLECHLVVTVAGSQDTSWSFVENSGYDPGSVCTAYNRNRRSSRTPQTQINIATGGIGAPTTLASGQFGVATAAGGRGGAGGEATSRQEVILQTGIKYAFTITALSANANNITASLDFYEHTPRD